MNYNDVWLPRPLLIITTDRAWLYCRCLVFNSKINTGYICSVLFLYSVVSRCPLAFQHIEATWRLLEVINVMAFQSFYTDWSVVFVWPVSVTSLYSPKMVMVFIEKLLSPSFVCCGLITRAGDGQFKSKQALRNVSETGITCATMDMLTVRMAIEHKERPMYIA